MSEAGLGFKIDALFTDYFVNAGLTVNDVELVAKVDRESSFELSSGGVVDSHVIRIGEHDWFRTGELIVEDIWDRLQISVTDVGSGENLIMRFEVGTTG